MTQAAPLQTTSVRARILRTLGLLVVAVMAMAACSSSTTTTTVTGADSDTAAASPTAAVDADNNTTSVDTADGEADTAAPTAVPPAPTSAPVEADEPESSDTSTADVQESSSGTSSVFSDGDFCAVARDLDENDPFDLESENFDFDVFSEDFFTYVIDLYDGLQAIAPDEISDDIAVVGSGMVEMSTIAAQFEYNLFDPGMIDALTIFDTAEFETASVNIENYLVDSCGIDPSGIGADTAPPTLDDDTQDAIDGLDDLDDEDLAIVNEILLSQFNLDPELKECLLANIPDLTQAAADPTILQQEVCGTTLFNVFQGLG